MRPSSSMRARSAAHSGLTRVWASTCARSSLSAARASSSSAALASRSACDCSRLRSACSRRLAKSAAARRPCSRIASARRSAASSSCTTPALASVSSLTFASSRNAAVRSARNRTASPVASRSAESKRASSRRACAIVCSTVARAWRPEIMSPPKYVAPENGDAVIDVECAALLLADRVSLDDAVVVLVGADRVEGLLAHANAPA